MKKRIAARSAAIGIRSNDIVGEGGVYKLAKVLNQHFYKLLSIHRLEGGDIYIYIYIYIYKRGGSILRARRWRP